MTGLSWVHCLGLVLAATSCGAQIFPFSNLKHIFDQKVKVGAKPAAATTQSSQAFLPTVEPSTTTLEPPSTTGLAPYFGPYSLFDEDDGYREFQRPDPPKPKLSVKQSVKPTLAARPPPSATKPTHPKQAYQPQQPQQSTSTRQTAPKQKKRLVESHLHPVAARPTRPTHLVPIKIAYEPTIPTGGISGNSVTSGDVHELPSGDGLLDGEQRPPLYLTPPRLPANPGPVDATPSSSSHAIRTTEGVVAAVPIPMPPVPAVYLRPPGPPGPSGPPEPILFKLSEGTVKLGLADVADAALTHSTNPSILRRPKPSTTATLANHKLTSAPHNALENPKTPGKAPGSKATNSDKHSKHGKGALGNHQVVTDKPHVLVESSAAESSAAAIALGPPQRTPANHRPGLRPQPQQGQQGQQASRAPKLKNHKPGPLGPARPVKYHNHRPGGLDGEESMTSLRYRKRPLLGPIEQEVAATGLQHTGKYPSSGDGDRVEFQMHGLQGPESYKFGYDTGSGHNRQFRYEERDPHGNVKGHYGYVDGQGKLQVVNYKADAHGGYSADVSKLQT